MPTRVDDAVAKGGGKWIVPWTSSRARPVGVCRSGGRGLAMVDEGVRDGGCKGIDGIVGEIWDGEELFWRCDGS